jgi:hypothetical protein
MNDTIHHSSKVERVITVETLKRCVQPTHQKTETRLFALVMSFLTLQSQSKAGPDVSNAQSPTHKVPLFVVPPKLRQTTV